MSHCIILGDKSDIIQQLKPLMTKEGWTFEGWNRDTQKASDPSYPRAGMEAMKPWDLVICAIGTVAPVGPWWKVNADEWEHGVVSNVCLPIRLLRTIWEKRKPNASVCFMAGANPNRAGPNYSSYYTGKMGLLKAIETIDAESPDTKLFALAPGIVFTKIHKPTYESGIINQGLEDRKKVGGTPIQKIYDCLKWCLKQPKQVIGGRNLCVSDPWYILGPELPSKLAINQSLYKLRRVE